MENGAMEWENQEYEEDNGKMTWIWNKGLAVGKKILVTGFVISSAPVILPPLVVISTLGLACAVPYGLFLATYACTEKLVTTWLPRPTMPITFEDLGTKDDDKYGGDVDTENEEEELERRVEMRLLQDEEGNHNKDELVKKNGYVEDADEEAAKEDEKPPEEIFGVMIAIEGEEKNVSNVQGEEVPFEVTDVTVELCQTDHPKEDEELVKETRGLIEKVELCQTDDSKEYEKLARETRGLVEKVELRQTDDPKEDEELVGEARGLVEKIRDEGMSDEVASKNVQSAEGEHVGAEEGLKESDRNVQENVTSIEDRNTHGGGAQDIMDSHVKQNREGSTDNEDAIEIADETGLNLFEDKNSACIDSSADKGTTEGSDKSSYRSVDLLEISVPSSIQAPESGGVASNEVLYSEEKIWKQIDAMRTIVGYNVARHATCIEELKALYVYTGVEPPASFKDPSDMVEINAKLRFLMSIVGVK